MDKNISYYIIVFTSANQHMLVKTMKFTGVMLHEVMNKLILLNL